MRPIWKGSISFGLVNIPISLYPATKSETLKFSFLRKSDQSRINNRRVAEADGKEVPWDEIVRGYEYEKGKFVIIKDEDFARVDVEATQTVDIHEFVELEEIDPMFFAKPYFMEPAKGGAKAYALLRDVLSDSGKVGISRVVIKTREHLAAVKAYKNVLVLELMHFADELASYSGLTLPNEVKTSKKELEMAQQLVASMTSAWDPKSYKDEYREALMDVIERKIAAGGKEPKGARKNARAAKPTNVIDLMEVLRKSLQNKGGNPKTKKSAKQKAAPAKARKKAA